MDLCGFVRAARILIAPEDAVRDIHRSSADPAPGKARKALRRRTRRRLRQADRRELRARTSTES